MRHQWFVSACAFLLTASAACAESPTATEASVSELITGMTRMGRCSFPAFSPDDKTICFVSNMSGKPELWTMPVGGGWPTQITWTTQPVIGESWSPNSDWIAFLAGAGERELNVVNVDGTSQHSLGMQCFISNWAPDGKHLFVGVDGKSLSVNPVTGEAKIFGQRKEKSAVEDVSHDGKFALLNTWGANGSDIYLLDAQTNESRNLTAHEGKVLNSGGHCNKSHPTFSVDGRTIYFISDAGRKKAGLAKIQLAADGTPGHIEYIATRDDANADGFDTDSGVTWAAVAWDNDDKASVDLVNLSTKETHKTAEIPINGSSVSEIAMSHDGKTVAATIWSKLSPTDIFVFNNGDSKWKQLTHAQHPGVNLAKLCVPEQISIPASDGTKIKATLFMPAKTSRPMPFIVALRGLDNAAAENEALVECGFGVIKLESQSSDEKDKVKLFKTKIAQIKEAVDYVVAKRYADPKHIGITGTFGCDALAAVAAYPDLFGACVARSNYCDYPALLKNSTNKGYFAESYGTPESAPEMAKLLSPIASFDHVKTPIMLQHGSQDSRIPIDQSQELEAKLKAIGTPVETLYLADEGNVILKPDSMVKCTTELVDFFSKYLQPDNRITIK